MSLVVKTEREGDKKEIEFLEIFINGRKYRIEDDGGMKITDSSYETKEIQIVPLIGNQILIK